MYFIGILSIILFFLVVEKMLHQSRLRSIPIRIHVNGTRGKTSVTRLIAGALRNAGIRTLAKTTGERPMLIYPDGHEEVVSSLGPSRIQETIRFIKKAARMNAEAVVVECMAIDPHLQFVSETKMIKSTIGVLTNVRPDHFEVMGKNLDDVAESLSQTIPKDAILVTADQKYFGYFELQAAEKDTKAYLVRETDPDSQQDPKEVLTLRENLLIAKKVCSLLGVAPSFAHNGLTNGVGDKGCWNTVETRNGKKKIHFIDAFSANDVESTKIVQQIALNRRYYPRPFVALFNNRTDRPIRMLSFVTFISSVPTYDYVMLIGDYRKLAKRYIHREGKRGNIFILRSREPQRLIDEICQQVSSPEFTVVGMGNFKGLGGELSRFLSLKGQN